MSNNLFISYDLNSPGQDYSAIIEAIKALGDWAKVQKSLWYVNSPYGAEEACKKVRARMDQNDSLIVIDASNNDAYWFGVPEAEARKIQQRWRA